MKLRFRSKKQPRLSHSVRDYRALVQERLRQNPDNPTLALVNAIGSLTMEEFVSQGDGHVAVLKYYGLADGMSVYDLGCGCGRTAQALKRSGWTGNYTGADVVPELLEELIGVVGKREILRVHTVSQVRAFQLLLGRARAPEGDARGYQRDNQKSAK